MTAEVNEAQPEGSPDEIYHSFADILEHVSPSETLSLGFVFGSGTVGGRSELELGRFLGCGDTVELILKGIGQLVNRVA